MPDTYSYERDALLRIGVVATRLGVTVATIRNWERAGKIRAVRSLGNQRMFRAGDVDRIREGR